MGGTDRHTDKQTNTHTHQYSAWSRDQAQENKLWLLSHLGYGMKTAMSLRERATLTLSGPVTGAARAILCFNSFLLHVGLSSSKSLPVMNWCWLNTHYTLRVGGRTHRGPNYGGERKNKEGSSDRSDRRNTDLFSE